jgi:hypothetical protein
MLMEQTALSNVAPSNTGTTLDTAYQPGTRAPDQDQIMLPSVICIDTQKHAGDIQQRDRLDNENWSSWHDEMTLTFGLCDIKDYIHSTTKCPDPAANPEGTGN